IAPGASEVVRLSRHVVRLRAQQRRSTRREARFRLRDVGASHFADIEAVTSLFQLLGEHFNVAAIEIKDRLVAYQIHVGGSGVEKNLLLGDPQRFACARHPAFRLACAIGGLKSVGQRLRRGCAELPGRQVRAKAAVDDLRWKHDPGTPVDRLSPATLPRAITEGETQSPSVLAAMYGVDVAELAVKISEGALYPNLGLTAAYTQNYQTIPQELRSTNVSILGQ